MRTLILTDPAVRPVCRTRGATCGRSGGRGVIRRVVALIALVASCTACLVSMTTAHAAPGDENWDDRFVLAGLDDRVYASVTDAAGDLYVAGDFTTADGVIVNRIARWDGSAWAALGGGLDATVRALAVDGLGNLYAGGDFTTAGGSSASRIARWDGSSWSAMGSGANSPVHALAVDGGTVYAGGQFSTAGGTSAQRVARWDGSAWSALGAGTGSAAGSNNFVSALALASDGTLYAGGNFSVAGGVAASSVAQWDGSAWSALGTGVDRIVRTLAVNAADELFAGGSFDMAGGTSVANVAKWDGSAWSALGAGLNNFFESLVVAPDGTVYAGGGFSQAGGVPAGNVAAWDGSSWSALGSGTSGFVRSLAVDTAGTLYAGGTFRSAGGTAANRVAAWSGSAWSALTAPALTADGLDGNVFASVADGAGNVYVAGAFVRAGGLLVNHVARWDGSRWSALGSGVDNLVRSLALDAAGNLYAGGAFTRAGGESANRIARWDGSAWSPLGAGTDNFVLAVAVDSGGALYAAGTFTQAGGVAASNVARWDGSAWSALGTGVDSLVWALAIDDTDTLYAGGTFTSAGGAAADRIARWDGAAWSALGSGMNNSVRALAVDQGGTLFAAGSFGRAGGASVPRVASWDGSAWTGLGTGGTSTSVDALAFDGSGALYAGGGFTRIANTGANAIARWDGSAWNALGSGTNEAVRTIAPGADGTLHVGGEFSAAGGSVSSRFARWSIASTASADLALTLTGQADPVSAGDTFAYTVDIANAGPATASNVRATIALPDAVTLVSSTGCGEDPAGVPLCTIGELAAGQGASVTLNVSVDTGATGSLMANASVTSDVPDPDTGDNGASASTAIVAAAGPDLVAPIAQSTLSGSTQAFSWRADGAAIDQWWLYLGTTPGARDLHDSGNLLDAVSTTVSALPVDGSTVHARLWYRADNEPNWQFIEASYTAATLAPPAITAPVDGATLPGTEATFAWAAGDGTVDAWWLYLGSAPQGFDYFSSGSLAPGTVSRTVTGLPSDGSTVHATLWYRTGGNWISVSSTYTAIDVPPPMLLAPAPGSTLDGSSAAASWSGDGNDVEAWWLYAGSAPGLADHFNSGDLELATDVTVTGLPLDGSTVHLTLWYRVGGVWSSVAETVTAADIASPAIGAPAPGSTLSADAAAFTWSEGGEGVEAWWLYAGSVPGLSDYYDSGNLGTSTTATVTGLPADGSTVHIRLWYRVNGAWRSIDEEYVAAGPGN